MPRTRCPNGTRKHKNRRCVKYTRHSVVQLSNIFIDRVMEEYKNVIDDKDTSMVKSRLKKLRYKKTFRSPYYNSTKAEQKRVQDEYDRYRKEHLLGLQAHARLAEYSKSYIDANEI